MGCGASKVTAEDPGDLEKLKALVPGDAAPPSGAQTQQAGLLAKSASQHQNVFRVLSLGGFTVDGFCPAAGMHVAGKRPAGVGASARGQARPPASIVRTAQYRCATRQ